MGQVQGREIRDCDIGKSIGAPGVDFILQPLVQQSFKIKW